MFLNSYDERRPYFDNKEVLEEYQMLLDYIFDYALDEEIGTDDFDLAAEALPDPSLDDAHKQIAEIMNWIDAREEVSSDAIPIVGMLRKLQLGRKEKLLFWLIYPRLFNGCHNKCREHNLNKF